ncbi:MAG: KTSC domain-containing protein [Janthinobacterium lividum]
MPSSVVSTMSYDESVKTLTIVYRHGRGTYRYFDVPPEVWAEFQAAESKGTYLNHVFKTHGYRFEKAAKK